MAAGLVGAASWALLARGPLDASQAVRQIWPPFALVTGLMLIGRVADHDGVFDAAGSWLARHCGRSAIGLLAVLLGLVALVTAALNLDTAVVFLTPVVIHATRARGFDERPFLYGTAFMCNSASLLLPGSNLTNLIVFGGAPPSTVDFALTMLLPWLAAVVVTAAVVCLAHVRQLRRPATRAPRAVAHIRGRTGIAGIAAAGALMLLARDAALPVLLVGLACVALGRHRRRSRAQQVLDDIPVDLVFLFAIAVALTAAARVVAAPALLMTAAPWVVVMIGAAAAVTINNLPAAALLSAHHLSRPLFLLLGLNLGPNLWVGGSLAAVLWLRVAHSHGATVSARRYALLGCIVAPLTLGTAMATLMLGPHLR